MGFDLSDILAALTGAGQGAVQARKQERADRRMDLDDYIQMENFKRQKELTDAQLRNYERDDERLERAARTTAGETFAKRGKEVYTTQNPEIDLGPDLGKQEGDRIPFELGQIFKGLNLPLITKDVTSAEFKPGTPALPAKEGPLKGLPTAAISTPTNVENDFTRPGDGEEKGRAITQAKTLADLSTERQGKLHATLAAQKDPKNRTTEDLIALKQFGGLSPADLRGPTPQITSGVVGGQRGTFAIDPENATGTPVTVGNKPLAPIPPASDTPVAHLQSGKVTLPNGDVVLANYNPLSGKWSDQTTGEVLSGVLPPPTAEMENKKAGRSLAHRSIDAVEDLSKSIITRIGPAQRADALKRGVEAVFGTDPEFITYQDARTGLAGNLAVAQQGSRPSDADIKAIWLPLVPNAYRDTKESAALKWRLVKVMIGYPDSAPPPGAKVFDALTFGQDQ